MHIEPQNRSERHRRTIRLWLTLSAVWIAVVAAVTMWLSVGDHDAVQQSRGLLEPTLFLVVVGVVPVVVARIVLWLLPIVLRRLKDFPPEEDGGGL